ncbi:hypothetical protein AK95_18820 [Paenibacillus sp. LC231]|nr:hypothetical protein AK95_18820 [Paenibacillus sp. LC231]
MVLKLKLPLKTTQIMVVYITGIDGQYQTRGKSMDNYGRPRVPLEQLWITKTVEMLKGKIFRGINYLDILDAQIVG